MYKIYTVSIEDAISEMQKSINKKENAAFFVESNKKFAYVPTSWHNQEFFSQYDVTGYNMFYDTSVGGGIIIGDPSDLSFLVMRPYDETKSICDDFEHHLENFIKSKFENSEFSGNDVMIDGKKSIGTASAILDGMTMFMFMASFADNSELINALCPPGHTKVPQPINSEILSKEEFKNEIITWLQ